jgi:hypothetical protein
MGEQREDQRLLVVVEHPLRLTHHDRVELAVGIMQCQQQPLRLGPAAPRHRSRLPDVEELLHDLAVAVS